MRKLISLMLLMMVIVVGCKKDDPVIVEYTVSFDSKGGSGLSPIKVAEGAKVTKPGDPVKEGETFLGWYKENELTNLWDFEKDIVTSNITLYAKWAKPDQKLYTITFETNGGSKVDPVTVIEGEKITKPSNPTKENCSFLGWYADPALTDAWPFAAGLVKADMTLYARWSKPGEKVYTVSFDTDGGSEIEAVSVLEKEKVAQPANPAKTGFEFDGWYSDPEKLTAYDFESLVTADMTLYGKWTKAVLALTDFEAAADFESKGILWDEATRTLDITNATAGSVLKFNAKGVTAVETSVVPFFNKNASSIGGETSLPNIVKVGSLVDGKIALKVNIPAQTFKVPLDISVSIQSFDNESESETITIKSRPDYNGTGIQPVMMKTRDNKLVFWAPVNVGATKMPEKASSDANTDITESCGKLFQWGRLYGFAATNNSATTDAEKFDGTTDPLGFPKGEGALADMGKWDGKFIISSSSSPNTQYNWLLFDAGGADNPADAAMEAGAWYQKLWNSGSEESPVKTKYDPCPAGWRVPTQSEWKAIGAGTNITDSWDATNKLMSIPGAESGQKLVLPAAGTRDFRSGASNNQGGSGNYWSSSVLSGSISTSGGVYFSSATLATHTGQRTYGRSVRCTQE